MVSSSKQCAVCRSAMALLLPTLTLFPRPPSTFLWILGSLRCRRLPSPQSPNARLPTLVVPRLLRLLVHRPRLQELASQPVSRLVIARTLLFRTSTRLRPPWHVLPDPGDASLPPPSESPVPQRSATDVGRPAASSSPGSPPAPSGAGLAASPSARDRSNPSVSDVDSAPSALHVLPDPGDASLPLSSESPVSQRSASDVGRPAASSSSGSSSAPSGAGLTASRSARDRSNRIVSVVAYDAKYLTAQEDLIDFALLDRAQLPGWVADLEEARRGFGRFIRRLRQEVADGSSSAPVED